MNAPNDTIIGSLAIQYSKNPAIKALLRLIPGWSSADGLLQTHADEIKRERLRYFFDELAKGKIPLTEDLLQSDDFLHCYFKAAQAAVKSHRREKVEMFARMLCGSLESRRFSGIEQYEELVDVLDSMSLREFAALKLLRDFEITYAAKKYENDVERIRAYWPEFKEQACRSLGIESDEFDPFMERLQRTGLYTRNTDAFWDSSPRFGKTTRQFEKLCSLVQEDAAEH